jgi:hypothetical protein
MRKMIHEKGRQAGDRLQDGTLKDGNSTDSGEADKKGKNNASVLQVGQMNHAYVRVRERERERETLRGRVEIKRRVIK